SSAVSEPQALVFIKQFAYGTKFTVTINGDPFSYQTSDVDASDTWTDLVASEIKTAIDADLSSTFTVVQQGSVLHIKRTNGADFTVAVEDGRGGVAMSLAKNRVQAFSDLPTTAPRDFIVEVVGASGNAADNYFVKFRPHDDASTFGEG